MPWQYWFCKFNGNNFHVEKPECVIDPPADDVKCVKEGQGYQQLKGKISGSKLLQSPESDLGKHKYRSKSIRVAGIALKIKKISFVDDNLVEAILQFGPHKNQDCADVSWKPECWGRLWRSGVVWCCCCCDHNDHHNATIMRREMRKLLTNDSNEADHRDEDAIAGVLIPLDNLAIQNCNEALWVYCIRCIGDF